MSKPKKGSVAELRKLEAEGIKLIADVLAVEVSDKLAGLWQAEQASQPSLDRLARGGMKDEDADE